MVEPDETETPNKFVGHFGAILARASQIGLSRLNPLFLKTHNLSDFAKISK